MLGGCEDGMDLFEVSSPLVPDELPPTVVASPIYRGPGPLPKYRAGREPTTAGKFEGGQLVQAILTKVVGSTTTSILPSSWSWSRCTNIATFA